MKDRNLIGKTYSEYLKIFNLNEEELYDKKILDIASGVNSFCVEANLKEIDVLAIDNIYFFDIEKIKENAKKYIDSENGKMALNLFLYDYKENLHHYQPTNLPKLNLKSDSFDLALISNLNDSDEFNIKLILEALRVAKKVKINIKGNKDILKDEKFQNFKMDFIKKEVIIITKK